MPDQGQTASKKAVLTVAAEQPCGVQVVEGVGLVAGSFQFFTRLAAVRAEEVGYICPSLLTRHI